MRVIEKTVYLSYGEDEVYVKLETDKQEVVNFAITYNILHNHKRQISSSDKIRL